MSDQSLGTISALVRLRFDELSRDVASVKALITDMGATVSAEAQKTSAETEASLRKISSLASELGATMMGAGAAIVGGLGAAVKAGADYETTIAHVASNTNMTTAQMKEMDGAIREMASHTSAPISELADGLMHVANFGFQGRDAVNVLREAMKSAVSTGGNTGKTAQLLANVLHEFGMKASDAARAMNLLHTAAAKGDMTLEQMVESGGRALGMAANLGVSLQSVTGAMSALTQHGFNAAESATQVVNIMAHLANTSSKTHDFIEQLGKGTGIDLVRDFSIAGLRAKDLTGILDDLRKAAEMKHMDIADVMLKAIPALRGGIGGMALQGTALEDFKNRVREAIGALKDLKGSDVTNPAWERETKTLNFQIGELRNQFTLLAADIEKALAPTLQAVLDRVREMVAWFQALPEGVKENIVKFTALAGVVAIAAGGVLLLTGHVLSLIAAFVTAGPVLEAIGLALSPFVGWIAAIGAAVALLVVAWQRDWGHIREHTQEFVEWIKPYLADAWSDIVATAKSSLGELKRFWHDMFPPMEADTKRFVGNTKSELAGSGIPEIFKYIWETSLLITRELWNMIKGVVETATKVIEGVIGFGMKLINGDWQGAWNAMSTTVSRAFEAILGTIMRSVEIAKGYIASLFGAVHSAASFAGSVGSALSGNGANDFGNADFGPGPHPPRAPRSPHPDSAPSKSRGGGAADALKDIQARAEEARKAIEDCNKEIFRLTHSPWQVKQRDVLLELEDRIKSGVPRWKAENEAFLKMAEIETERQNAGATMAHLSQLVPDMTEAFSALGKMADHAFTLAAIKARDFAEKMAAIAPMATAAGAAIRDMGAAFHMAALEQGRQAWGKAMTGLTGGADLGAMFGSAGAAVAKARQMAEEVAQVRAETNQNDWRDWIKLLNDKVNSAATYAGIYSKEWQRANEQLGEAIKRQMEANAKAAWRPLTEWQKVLRSMADTMTGVFEGAFQVLFKHGFGKFFEDVLKGFTQMLEQMVAQLLAKSIIFGILSLFGGGLPGMKSFGSFLGFDDWGNDRKAQHWGFDYADHFTRGMQQFGDQRTPAGGSSRSQTTVHAPVTVHAVINHEMDIDTVSRKIAWNIQQKMMGTVT